MTKTRLHFLLEVSSSTTTLLSFLILLFLGSSVLLFFSSPVYAADTTPPISTLTATPLTPNGDNGWYTTYPQINIDADDSESGVSAIHWKINNGVWNTSDFSQGLNLIHNPSFESGYITDWNFEGPIFSFGLKSSITKHTGNYSAVIICINPFTYSYWTTTDYLAAQPFQTYNYSFYMMSYTSWLDNAFYEIILETDTGETIIVRQEDIDIKLNYKKYSGSFTLGDFPSGKLYLRIGITRMGQVSIDDAYMSLAGVNTSVDFTLNQEGHNTIYYYSEDSAGNIEGIKQSSFNVDVTPPIFTNFSTFNQESLQKFASQIDVSDATSFLVSNPSLFNYAVDGITDGYYENYNTCTGNFLTDSYIDLTTNYSNGSSSGTVSTPQIDYCDANWINCKKLNFYVKDLAGNVGSHSICVNGPYIVSNYGNTFARQNISQMGLGTEPNIWGVAVSGTYVSDISSSSNIFVKNYQAPYLNTIYSDYSQKLAIDATYVTNIDNTDGIFILDQDYAIDTPITYVDNNQLIFINGNLIINQPITSDNSEIFYLVNGDIIIDNTVQNVDVNLLSTNQIFTSLDENLSEKVYIEGALIGQNLVFSRSTDRTLGASEIINFPVNILFNGTALSVNNIYWREKTD